MRISKGFYGDYVVQDELPFTMRSIFSALIKISQDDRVDVMDWHTWVTQRNGLHELVFWNPYRTDE